MQKFKKESEVLVMDSPTSKSRNKVLILIVGLLIVAVVAVYGVISSGVLEEKIDAKMEITAQIESDNLAYVTVETNLPDETNIIVSLVGAGDSDDTGYNTNYKADDSLQIVDGKAVAGPFSNNGVALPFGDYKVEVTVPLAETQPQDVQKVFGKENIDTSTPTGRLMLTMIGAINEFERCNLLERQREGIAIAKAQGKFKGRKEVKADDFAAQYQRYLNRELNKAQLAKTLGISRPTLDKLIRQHTTA